MTRNPVLSTLIPIVPLVALGWPLAEIIHQDDYQQIEPPAEENLKTISANVDYFSAHPISEIVITSAGQSWTMGPDDAFTEIQIPAKSKISLKVTVTWPSGTPESAVNLKLTPDKLQDRSHTIWGTGEVTKEIKFEWTAKS